MTKSTMVQPNLESTLENFCETLSANCSKGSNFASPIFAITGGPNAGKTQVLRALRQLGVNVIGEAATTLIEENGHEIRHDLTAFQTAIFIRQLQLESEARLSGQLTICDRGILDVVAYFKTRGSAVPQPIASALERIERANGSMPLYQRAFVCETVPVWDDNGIRFEDISFSRTMGQVLCTIYGNHNIPVTLLPLYSEDKSESIQWRTRAIFEHAALPS